MSSSELSKMLGLTASQVRQDFSCFGAFGQQGYGYHVKGLREEIAQILGMDRGYKAVLVGVGNIGKALIDKFSFNEWGFEIVCAFDTDPDIIGTLQNGIPVLAAQNIPAFLRENPVDIAVLTVPKKSAIPAAKLLIDNGVEAIWNFTNVEIVDPHSNTLVENVHFSDSLLSLSYFLTERNIVKDETKAM